MLFWLLACDGGESGSDIDKPYLVIVSPEQGDVYEEGEDVELEVEAEDANGIPYEIQQATWYVEGEDWETDGEHHEVDDLPTGVIDLVVEAMVEGVELTQEVRIEIEEGSGDGGDGGDGGGGDGGDGGDGGGDALASWAGSMDANVRVVSDTWGFTAEGPCPGSMSIQEYPGSSLSGYGACTADLEELGDYDVTFDISGQKSGNSVSGQLSVKKGSDTIPFSGSVSGDGTITATYDKTFQSSGGSLRIWGSFTAFEE